MSKNTRIKLRFYPSFLYCKLEKWLKKQSLKGWHLYMRRFGCLYYFKKGNPLDKEYFVWSPDHTGEGKYSINMRYPFLEKTYGVSAKKSKLNYNSEIKNETIIEVDTTRIDVDNDLSFKELKYDRNRLYMLLFIRNTSIFIAVSLLLIILKVFVH